MPAGIGYDAPPPEAMLGGMGAMLGGAPGAAPPPGATEMSSNEGGDAEVIAALALENVKMRQLLGLGPDDPVPDPAPEAQAPAPAAPGAMPAPF